MFATIMSYRSIGDGVSEFAGAIWNAEPAKTASATKPEGGALRRGMWGRYG
jgi:hypothetical protein